MTYWYDAKTNPPALDGTYIACDLDHVCGPWEAEFKSKNWFTLDDEPITVTHWTKRPSLPAGHCISCREGSEAKQARFSGDQNCTCDCHPAIPRGYKGGVIP